MKHTPGPWYANGIVVRPANIDRNPCIAVADDQDRLRPEQEANARLIAAAPEMLDALRRLTHPMADDTDVEFALEVIAKATK